MTLGNVFHLYFQYLLWWSCVFVISKLNPHHCCHWCFHLCVLTCYKILKSGAHDHEWTSYLLRILQRSRDGSTKCGQGQRIMPGLPNNVDKGRGILCPVNQYCGHGLSVMPSQPNMDNCRGLCPLWTSTSKFGICAVILVQLAMT